MLSTRRLRLAAAVVAVLAVALVLALVVTAGDDNDAVSVASDATTSTSLAAGEDTSTSSSSIAGSPTTTAGVTRTTAKGSPAAPGPVTTAARAPATTTAPAGCSRPAAGSDYDGFGATEIVIENSEGSHRSCVLTADTTAQQERGLSRQDDLDGYDGMIFRFPNEEERGFWMRNTRIPLSIAFFGASGNFVSATDMEPCGDSPQCPGYRSNGPAKYAIEVIQGRLPAVGATVGSRLIN